MFAVARRLLLNSVYLCKVVDSTPIIPKVPVLYQQVAGKKIYKKPLDPHHADDIYEFVYVGERSKPDTLVYVWGVADHGGLGRPSFLRPKMEMKQKRMHYRYRPHRLSFGEYYKVVDIACGYGFTTFAVSDAQDGSCFGTGLNNDSQIGDHDTRKGEGRLGMLISPAPINIPLTGDAKVKKVSSGRAHTAFLTDQAGVWTVGNNAYGQCGRPIISDEDYQRKAIFYQLKSLNDIQMKQVECGQDTSFFLSEEGVVYSCGWGADGQTGRGHYDNEPSVGPVVGDVSGENIVKVSCRADCVLALNEKGEVFGWGNNEYHQLSSVTDEMQSHTSRKLNLPDVGKIIDIASAGTMCMVLNEDGEVFTWGYGILGKGPAVSYSKNPTQIPSSLFGRNQLTPDAKVESLYCGINSFAAVNNYSSLFTWGKNPGGCLGLGHVKDQYFPFRVAIAGKILKVSCGVDHMAAVVREIL